MNVGDIMVREFHCALPTDTIIDVAQAMKRHNVGAVPVCQDGRLVGIITDRDIVIECVSSGLDPRRCLVQEYMTSDPLAVTPDTDIKQAASLMGGEQIRRLPVVQNGRLVGLISLGDIAVNVKDDAVVAEMLRRISIPVRTAPAAAMTMAAGGGSSSKSSSGSSSKSNNGSAKRAR